MKTIIKNYLSYAVDNELLKMINNIIKSDEWIREAKQVQEQNKIKHIPNSTDSYHMTSKSKPVAPTIPSAITPTTVSCDNSNTSSLNKETTPPNEPHKDETEAISSEFAATSISAPPPEEDDDEFDLK